MAYWQKPCSTNSNVTISLLVWWPYRLNGQTKMEIMFTKARSLARCMVIISGYRCLIFNLINNNACSFFFPFLCLGRAHNIVVAERVVLNFMQRMSGIATLTKVHHQCSFKGTSYYLRWFIVIPQKDLCSYEQLMLCYVNSRLEPHEKKFRVLCSQSLC